MTLSVLGVMSALLIHAQTIDWQGHKGDFNVASNWIGGVVPGPGTAPVNDNGSNNIVVITNGDPAWTVNDIRAGDGANASGSYIQYGDTVNVGNAGGWFRLGDSAGATGYYTIRGGNLNMTGGNFHVGESGSGVLNIFGGTITSSPVLDIGDPGTGSVSQTNGTMTISNQMFVANSSSAVSTYTLAGGSLNVQNWFVLGRSGGSGTMYMTGGTFTMGGNGGNFDVGTGFQGNGVGVMNQSGGTLIINNGSQFLCPETQGGTGTYNLSGTGVLSCNNWIAVGRGGVGTLNMSGGMIVKTDGNGDHIDIGAGGSTGGTGPGTVNQTGGIVTNTTSDLWLGEASDATWNLDAGTDYLGTVQICVNGGITGTLNLNGGLMNTAEINSPSDGQSYLNLNGGILQASQNNASFINNITTVSVQPAGAVFDSQGFSITVPEPLTDDGGGDVTKLGNGTLILSGANTYTGNTVVSNGLLFASSDSSGGGGVTVSDGAAFGVLLSSPGGQLSASSATIGNATGGNLDFNLGAWGDPTVAPLMVAGTLKVIGTTPINIQGTALAIGQFQLVAYGSLAGPGSFVLGSLPVGTVATLSNNVANSSVDLVITRTAGVTSGGRETVGYWQFNNSANLGSDSSGLGNDLAAASGSPAYSNTGEFGGALYLDGGSTMTTLSGLFPNSVPTGANPYTIGVWEKAGPGCPDNGGFVGWGDNLTSQANNLRLNSPNSVDEYWFANDFIVAGLASNPMDGNWHAIVVTWDGIYQIMYVDGVNVGTRFPTAPSVAGANFVVGATTADVDFLGWIDNLLIANFPMTPQEVAIYQAGNWPTSPAPYPELPTASPSNTVYAGTTVTLNVPVVGSSPLQYQWQKNGTDISSGTGPLLVLTNAAQTDSGSYSVTVGNPFGTNTSPALAVTVAPASGPVFVSQPSPASSTNYLGGFVTFTVTVNGTPPIDLQWQHNGVNILNATASSLTLASLQPGAAGSYTVIASNSLGVTNSFPALLTVAPPPNPSALNVLTYHNDNTRQGANTNEVILTPGNVNVSTFGRLMTYPTDGYIFAQPLYVSGLVIPGQGTHNTVFVVTENNTVYAFDADSNAGTNGGLLWQTNLGTAVSSFNGEFGTRYQGTYYGDIVPVVGITGTPVIDPASGTLYVNVHTREVSATSTNYYHRIHALNIKNGSEQPFSPMVVSNSVPGTGVGSSSGIVAFSAIQENQRPGMTLAGGMVYAAYGSYADTDPYHGWVIGFNQTNLAQSASYVFNTTPDATVADFGPNAGEGALWMGGNGLCADTSNNLFFATANGSFSANTNGGDYADSFIHLSTTNGFSVADYFTPYNQAALAANDTDLGSGGTILLPDSAGSAAHPHLMVGAGKAGTIYLVDRDSMGHFNAANDSQIVQELPRAFSGAWSTPAWFNNQIYYQGSGDVMRAFLITNGVIVAAPVSVSETSFSALGGTPVVSANGTNNGIVWTLQSDASGSSGAVILHAYNATNLSQELYNSSQDLARDNPGAAIKMTTPIVVNGKVFVPAQYQLSIFGNSLFLAAPMIAPVGGLFTNSVTVTLSDATPNSTIYYTLDGSLPTTSSLVYTGAFVLTASASVQAVAAQPGAVNSAVASASFVDSSAIGSGTGLLGSYWSNVTSIAFTNASFSMPPTLVRTDATVNFNWATTPPAPSIGLTNFVVRWIGSVQPEYSEPYTFTTLTDNGVRLYVDGQLLIDQWVNQPATAWSNTIPLIAQQRYNIEMDFYNRTGGAVSQLYWNSPSTPYAVIPQTQLYPVTNPPPAVVLTAPSNGASYTAAASVSLSADADAQYNPLSFVSFYTDGALVGSVSNAPYALTLTGVPAGNYILTATATDGSGLSSTSAPVAITVNAGNGLPYGLTTDVALGPFLNNSMPGSYTESIPAVLSATGAFIDTANRVPAGGLIPYVPNTPLWSDGAQKSRYLALPYSGSPVPAASQVGFASTGHWSFPSGTVFVKNFDLVVDETNTNVPPRRLETRLLVRDINGAVYGVTYKWRPDNSDADLLTGSLTEAILVTNATGVATQNWYYPSPADCLTCHTPVSGYVLGVNARQLNGTDTYPSTGVTDNQLRTLNRMGLFNPAFDEAAITGFEQLSSIGNTNAPLVQRARSYLDANCAQCHQPGGTGITFDARYDTPPTNQNIINVLAAFSLGYDNARIVAPSDIWRSVLYDRMNTVDPTIKMPTLARNLVDSNAVAVMAEWINSLGGTPALPPPVLTPSGGTFNGFVSVTAQEAATNDALYYTLDGTLPTTNSTLYTGPIFLTNSATVNVNAWAPGYVNSVATAAQFMILPGMFFTAPGTFTNGVFQMSFVGPVGSNYVLQVSTDLVQWTSISTNTPATSPFVLIDPRTPAAARFYRVLRSP